MTARVSSLWVGPCLRPYERLCLTSLVDAGYQVELFCYDPALAVPDGVARLDAGDVVPPDEIFEIPNAPGTFAAFSDVFRYRLLQAHETTWVDTDILAGGVPLPSDPYVFGLQEPGLVNGAVLRAPGGSGLLRRLTAAATSSAATVGRWGAIGPDLLTATVTDLDLLDRALAPKHLYPVHFLDVWQLFDPAAREQVERARSGAMTLHLWHDVMRRIPGLTGARPPAGSFLNAAFALHGVTPPDDGQVDARWVQDVWRSRRQPPHPVELFVRRAPRAVRSRWRQWVLRRPAEPLAPVRGGTAVNG